LGTSGLRSATEAAQLGLADQAAHLLDEGQRRVERRARRAHGGAQVGGEPAQRRQRAVELAERGAAGAQRAGQLADRPRQVGLLDRERVGGLGEVGHEVLQLLRVAVQALGEPRRALEVVREVVLEDAERRVVDDRRVAEGRGLVLDRPAVAVAALGVRRLAVLLQDDLEVLARVALQRLEHGEQADRRSGLRRRDRAALGEAPGPTASRASPRRSSCPRGRCADGSSSSRRA
jgi:hypothetical protein